MKKTFLLVIAIIVNFSQFITAQGEKEDTVKYTLPSDIVITAPRLSIPLSELPFATGIVDRVFLKTLPKSLAMDEALNLPLELELITRQMATGYICQSEDKGF